MDLVDEEHVALFELGQDGRQIAGPFERRAGRDVQRDAHLGGGDAGQRRLAQPGWTGEQQVVDGLAASPGRLDDDPQVLLQLTLPDEVGEQAGPQAGLDDVLVLAGRPSAPGTHPARRAPSSLRASRSNVAASRSVGSSRRTSRTSSGP